MSDLQVLLLHDPADDVWARDAKAALEAELERRIEVPSDRPEIELRDALTRFPARGELGPLSMVVVVNPDRPLSAEEQAAARRFIAGATDGDLQLLPVAVSNARAWPPAPLDPLVSAHWYSASDPVAVSRVATTLLNRMALRLAGAYRRVFLSYRMMDGRDITAHVAAGLMARGYDVWRDELADRDGVPMIAPGSPAQQTIERAIMGYGFVIVIDTPQAHRSRWVQEEVEIAVRYMLPVLPVVIEDVVGHRPLIGGRFPELTAMQREVRRDSRALTPAQLATVLDETFFDELEREMNKILLEHLRSRRRLLHDTEHGFRAMSFRWRPVDAARLLFYAELDRDSDTTPDVVLRLLVQCSPYNVVLDGAVGSLHAARQPHDHHCQFAILVHQAAIYGSQRRSLVRGRGGHLLVLRSDELDALATMLQLTQVPR